MVPKRLLGASAWVAAVFALAIGGCSSDDGDDKDPITGPVVVRDDCAGCHSDRESIEATAAPVEVVEEDPGEG